MMIRHAAFSVFILSACQSGGSSGRMAAKVSEVELTTQTSSSTTIEKTTIAYDGSRITSIAQFQNGAAAGTAKVTYGASGIEKIEYLDKEGDRATESLTYADGRPTKARYEVMGVLLDERAFSYMPEDRDLLKEITMTHTPTAGLATSSVVKYDYDGEGRVGKVERINGSTTSSTEFRYAPDGNLERATSFSGATHVETYNFSYTREGKLDEVVDSKNTRHEVTYDQQGRISEIRHIDRSTTRTWRYAYTQGTADGWTFSPAVPGFGLFDLAGSSFSAHAMNHGDIEIPRDIPKAPSGGMTCGFTPQDTCDTCLVNSCCSQAKACVTGTPCYAFYDCARTCSTQSCVDVCRQQHTQGAAAYDAYASCAQSFCSNVCQ